MVIEVATFTAGTIRQTGKRFDEKTDASIRYEKGLDTQRVDQGIAMAAKLFREIFPESKIVAFGDVDPTPTTRNEIDVTQEFLDVRLSKALPSEEILDILTRLGYDVTLTDGTYHCVVPTYRSTGDVSVKDDVLGDIARVYCYENFEMKPLPVNFEHAVRQPKEQLDRKIREYLAFRCGFNEIFTYPWIDEKYIQAAKIDTSEAIRLATPPAPELAILRQSLIPGMLEAAVKNLRYYDEFRVFEMAQTFHKGEYHESCEEEILPVHKKLLSGIIVGRDAKKDFFDVKGVLESMSRFCHMEDLTFKQKEKPSWADDKVYLNVFHKGKNIGSLGLVSVQAMNAAGISRTQVAFFELNFDEMIPLNSRNNEFHHLPQYPLVEQDLSILVDESVKWHDVSEAIRHMVKKYEFIEEYRGKQIPEGKKSLVFRVWIGNDDSTMTSKQIDKKMAAVMKSLQKKCGAALREE